MTRTIEAPDYRAQPYLNNTMWRVILPELPTLEEGETVQLVLRNKRGKITQTLAVSVKKIHHSRLLTEGPGAGRMSTPNVDFVVR